MSRSWKLNKSISPRSRRDSAQGVVINTVNDLDQVQQWVRDGAHGTLVVDMRISRNVVAPYIQEIIELTIKR